MDFLSKIFGKKEIKKQFVSTPNFFPIGSINATFSTASRTAFVDMFYNIPEIYSIVDYLSSMYASVPIKVGKTNNDGTFIEIKTGQAAVIAERIENPNKYNQRYDFDKLFWTFLLTTGNSFIHAVRTNYSKIPTELYVLPANEVELLLKNANYSNFETNEILKYVLNFGSIIDFEPTDTLHLKYPNLRFNDNYFLGISPLQSAIMLSDSLKNSYDLKVSMYQNRGAMGILSTADVNNPIDNPQELHDKYVEKYGTGLTKRQILITTSNVNWQPMNMPFNDFEIIQNQSNDFKTLCTLYNVPSALMNNTDSSSYNNISTFRKIIYTQNINPMLERYCKKLTVLTGANELGFEVKPDFTNIPEMQEDNLSLNQILEIQFRNGIISRDEWRSKIKL